MICKYKKYSTLFCFGLKKSAVVLIFSMLVFFPAAAVSDNDNSTPNSLRVSGMNFVENKGQIVDLEQQLRPDILFRGESAGTTVYLRKTGVSYVLSNANKVEQEVLGELEALRKNPSVNQQAEQELMNRNILLHRVDMSFEGANPDPKIISSDKADDYLNFYYAHCPNGITNVSQYRKILYQDIYPGIDIIFYGNDEKGLKYDIIVKPGGNPDDIKIKYTGHDGLSIDPAGDKLTIETSLGKLTEHMPKVYQNIDGKITDIKAGYRLTLSSSENPGSYREEGLLDFELGTFNSEYPLIIDPWITYYGGYGGEYGSSVTTDNAGNVIASGMTTSTGFPLLGSQQTTIGGSYDAFLVKFNGGGIRQWAIFYGGTNQDFGWGVAVDAANNVYQTGRTLSTNFPVINNLGAGAYSQPFSGGSYSDVMIAKFNSNGILQWSTCYGGQINDEGSEITIDAQGNIIIAGSTYLGGIIMPNNFPVLNAYSAPNGNSGDAIVLKFNSGGVLQWATCYGGWWPDRAMSVASDGTNIFICGNTNSTNFPIMNAYQSTPISNFAAGCYHAYLAKLNANGFPVWSTYYGGNGPFEYASSVAVDGNGDVIMAGETMSTTNIATAGAFQTSHQGGLTGGGQAPRDAFVAKFSNSGSRLWATYLGGSNQEYATGVAIGPNNSVLVGGDTYSADFPVTSCAYQTQFTGTSAKPNHFVTHFDTNGDLICSGFIGEGSTTSFASFGQNGGSVATSGGMLYFVGHTWSAAYPTTPNAFQPTYKGSYLDATIAQLCLATCGRGVKPLDFSPSKTKICPGTTVDFTNNSVLCDTSSSAINSYQWFFNGATPATSTLRDPRGILYNTPGTYTVKMIINTQCGLDSVQKFVIVAPPTVSIARSNAKCGDPVGRLSATQGPYTYQWMPGGATTNIISNLAAGTYTLTIVDTAGCTNTYTTVIASYGTMTLSPSVINPACNGATTGSISLAVTGSYSPFKYTWSNGRTTSAISNLTPGVYTVTVTNMIGCTKDTSLSIVIPSPLTVQTMPVNISCNGYSNGIINTSVSGGSGPYQYSWSPGGRTTSSLSNLSAGTYTLIVTDANSCTQIQTVTLSEPASLSVNAGTVVNVNCNGQSSGSANITVVGGTAPYTYSWNNNSTTQQLSNLNAGVYTITVTDAAGCTGSQTIAITQPAAIAVSAGTITHVTCNGLNNGSANIIATGGTSPYIYSWNNNSTTQQISNLNAGTYTVTVADANGCTQTQTVNITQPTAISANISVTDATCGNNNGTATVSANGGTAPYSYSWSNGQMGITASGLGASTHTVTITDANGCTQIQSVNISSANGPTASISAQTNVSCYGLNNGSSSVTVGGGAAPYTYQWSNGPTTATATGLAAGSYSVLVTDANGCTQSQVVTITQPAALIVNAGVITHVTCNGLNNGSAGIIPSGGTAPYTYSWNNNSLTQQLNNLNAGVYTVTVSDANGCSQSQAVTITQPSQISLLASPVHVTCNGSGNGSAGVIPSGGTAPYTYSWNNNSSTQQLSNLNAGVYTVTVSDANGCTQTQAITITQPAAITANISSTNATCGNSNGTASINANGGTGTYTYSWSNGQTNTTATALGTSTYTVTVTDANGCTLAQTINIASANGPTASISAQKDVSCKGSNDGSATVTATGGTGAYTYSWSNNSATAQVNNLTAGTYTVIVSDANGCTSQLSVVITEPPLLSASVSTQSNLLCNGDNNGSATVLASGGAGAYSYSWNTVPVQNTSTASGLVSGTYSVQVTDNNGCTSLTSVTITEPALLTAAVSSYTFVSCSGGNNGSAAVTATGGTPGLSYVWSTSPIQSSAVATGLLAGTYSVTITDANNCSVTVSATITEPSPISLAMDSVAANCGQSDGSASVIVTGGTPGYQYLWNTAPAQVIANATGIPSGNYQVTVTDLNGCTQVKSVAVLNNAGVNAQLLSSVNVSCSGSCNGQATAQAIGGNTPYIYNWSTIPAQTGPSATGLCSGTYTVNITDNNNCIATATVNITQPVALASAVSTQTNVSCNGGNNGSATVLASGGTGAYSYSWNTVPVQNMSTASNLIAGTYTVQVTDNNGCTDAQIITITEPLPLTFTSSSTPDTCGANKGTASVTASGGTRPYSYAWSNGSTNTGIYGYPAGICGVTVTDSNNCILSGSVTISSYSNTLVLSFTHTDINCFGSNNGSASVNVSGGNAPYTFLWPATGSVQSTISSLTAGTYNVQVTDKNGCTSVDSVTILQPLQSLSCNIQTTDVSCNGGANGSVRANVSGGAAPYNYQWNPVNQNVQTITNLVAGIYTITVSDANGCTQTNTATVSQPSAMNINGSVNAVKCNGGSDGSAGVTVSGGTPGYTYSWNTTPPQNTANANGLIAGNYNIIVTDNNGCTQALMVTITEPPVLTVLASNSIICSGQSAMVNASASGGTGAYNFRWLPGNQNGSGITVSPAATTIYTVQVTDANGCTATQTPTVTVNALPVISINQDVYSGCAPVCVNFSLTSTPMANNAVWTFGDGTGSASFMNGKHCYDLPGNYSVSLTVTDINGCSSAISNNSAVIVYPLPTAAFTSSPQNTTILNPIVLFNDQSAGANAWQWSFGDKKESTSVIQHPNFTYQDTGTYVVRLVAINEFGCTDTIYSTVYIQAEYVIYIPNTFTPNEDGLNDVFLPVGLEIDHDHFEMYIFDRWGDLIYKTNNVNQGWNGKANGGNDVAQQDTYVWKVNVTDMLGHKHRYVGHVNLIR